MRAAHLFLGLLLGFATLSRPAAAQGVMIAPHKLFMTDRTRTMALTLHNPGTEPVEITVGTFFGYPITDSAGAFDLYHPERPGPDDPNAAEWIEAYPRRMALRPGQRQTVRLLARPPADLPDGEYWSRLVVTARGGTVPVTGADSAAGITVGLTLEVRSVLPLHYRNGELTTGVRIEGVRTDHRDDTLHVRVALRREGPAAFLGTARLTLRNDAGDARTTAMPLGVFTVADPAFELPVAGLPPGRYRLVVELVSERADLEPGQVLPIRPVRDSIPVAIP
jgi:P pilus assembly chaperone PapD